MSKTILSIIFSLIVFISIPALAQDATVIDIVSPLTALITLLGAVLGVLGMWLWNKFAPKWGLNKIMSEAAVRSMLDKVLDEAVEYGVGKISKADWTKIETKNEVVALAAAYVIDHSVDLLEQVGLDQDFLIEKLESKILKHDEYPGVWLEE